MASIYLPIRKTLVDVGESLSERLIQHSPGPRAPWKERSEAQQATHTYLRLQESALQELQQGLSVLAPLLAGISSRILSPGG